METRYPVLEIDLKKLRQNAEEVVKRCGAAGIQVAGVIKGFSGFPQAAEQLELGGCSQIASSRLSQLEEVKAYGLHGPFMLIRIPMLSELPRLVRTAEYSLQSERTVIDALEKECAAQNKTHSVVIMADLGDLREGMWNKDELCRLCLYVEQELSHVKLAGIGTNLGCYGSIKTTPEKMEELVALAGRVEALIGRKLEIVSGACTPAIVLVHEHQMPPGMNHARIGGGMILARDMEDNFGMSFDYIHKDAFTLKAEIVEVQTKPSYPVGEIFVDCFSEGGHYVDRGMRKRALAAVGKVDCYSFDKLIPRLLGVEVIGGSSDHTILDIEECEQEIQVGDVLEFDLCYAAMVFLSSAPDVTVRCIE
ncbi:alanine racemase [Bacilliculturomica massiliensis]|uniref:alanine racemase n=1 Tax=Bacilliculturomica massiliensis TaxID=1917867 RepID=UPI00102F48BD|nr:alanine racemase [Bacilliculturomica massiliensis]